MAVAAEAEFIRIPLPADTGPGDGEDPFNGAGGKKPQKSKIVAEICQKGLQNHFRSCSPSYMEWLFAASSLSE